MHWYTKLKRHIHHRDVWPVIATAAFAFLICASVTLAENRISLGFLPVINQATQTACVFNCGAVVTANSFTATPQNVNYGGSSTLSWSATNADYCMVYGGRFGPNISDSSPQGGTQFSGPSGSANTGALYSSNTEYNLRCFNVGSQNSGDSNIITLGVAAAPPATQCSSASGGGAYGTYPSCTCNGAGYTYNSSNNSCTAPAAPPTGTIAVCGPPSYSACGGSVTVTLGQQAYVGASFAPASGQSLTASAIVTNTPAQTNPDTYGSYLRCDARNGCNVQSLGGYFTPSGPGTYQFWPTEADTSHAWGNYTGASVTVNVSCPAGTTRSGTSCVAATQCSSASGGGAYGTYPSCTCNGAGYTYNSSNNSCTAPATQCSSASGGGAYGTYPSCQCNLAGYAYSYATNSCAPSDLCPSLPGTQTSYPSGSSPASSCICPSGSTYNQSANSCQAAAVAAPTLTIKGNGQSGTVSVTVGQSVSIVGTFAAGSGDTLLYTALNDYQNNALPGVPNTTATSPKSYVFTPTGPGSFVFYPAARTAAYTTWNNYGKMLFVSVSCPAGQTNQGGTCVPLPTDMCSNISGVQTAAPANGTANGDGTCSCNSGYTLQGSQCVAPTCSGTHQVGTPPDCNCDVGYSMQGGQCVQQTCPGAHEVGWPSCSCDTGYTRDGATQVCIEEPVLSIKVNGLDGTRVRKGTGIALTWSATGIEGGTCSVKTNTGSTIGSGDSGTLHPTVAAQTTYTLTCLNEAGSPASKSANVTLIPDFIEN